MTNRKNHLAWMMGLTLLLAHNFSGAQSTAAVAANAGYMSALSRPGLGGQRYRLEWGMPVRATVVKPDTLFGGLQPYAIDSSLHSQLVYLRSASGDAYILRPVQKSFANRLDSIYQGTIISGFANDLTSAFHPYAEMAAAPLAQAVGLPWPDVNLIYSTTPYNKKNSLYFLQKSPAPAGADTLTNFITTGRLLQLLQSSQMYAVDEKLYLKARLLDALLGVSNRSEESWHWLAQNNSSRITYKPVPLHYDDAFAVYDGRLTQIARALANIKYLQSFGPQLPTPTPFNLESIFLDRRLTDKLNRKDWEDAANEVITAMSDGVLQKAISAMPAEVQPLSGNRIATLLRSRRAGLQAYAMQYYELLAKRVDVAASAEPELITASGSGNALTLNLQPIGTDSLTSLYNRTFVKEETSEVNVYGISGQDVFSTTGERTKGIRLRFIAGPQQDSLAVATSGPLLDLYDNRSNNYNPVGRVRFHLRNRTGVNRYDYNDFGLPRKGFAPRLFYNYNDRLYVGVAYQQLLQGWRRKPYAQWHRLYAHYSVLQNGISTGYDGVYTGLIRNWNAVLTAEYDAVRWTNFFGVGNETPPQVGDNDFYRMRTEVFNTEGGFQRSLGNYHSVGIVGHFQTVRIRRDADRYIFKNVPDTDALLFRTRQFAGARFSYRFQNLDNNVLPGKGLLFNSSAEWIKNLTQQQHVMDYTGSAQVFLPLRKNIIFSVLAGGRSVVGEPEFYQLASIGGTSTLRGFRRDRFWGKTAFYNQNELQWRLPYRSYWFNGTIAFIALYDMGRVWQPGEQSDKLHTGVGGGFMVSPFNRIQTSLTYAKSGERGLFHIGFSGSL